jgi:hypothetical protein
LFNGEEVRTSGCTRLQDAKFYTTSPDGFSADDSRTALQAPLTARFTNLGVPVLLRIFIQLRKYDGRRRTSHLCRRTNLLSRESAAARSGVLRLAP